MNKPLYLFVEPVGDKAVVSIRHSDKPECCYPIKTFETFSSAREFVGEMASCLEIPLRVQLRLELVKC